MLTESERKEREALQREFDLCALGDRPHCPSAEKLRRMIELDAKADYKEDKQ